MGRPASLARTSAAAARYRSGAKRKRAVPAIFGTVARTEILMLLAVNGPTHVRELARLRRVDSATTFRTVDRLIEAKLVAKRDRKRRQVALDRSHRGHHELLELLLDLDGEYPVRRIVQARYRHYFPLDRDRRDPPEVHTLFGSETRSKVLLLLGTVAEADLNEIAAMAHLEYCAAAYALNGLEIERIVRTRRVGRRRVADLDPHSPWTPLLRRYIERVVRLELTEYADIVWLRDVVETAKAY